jgi:sulfite exporter TauE/SafE
MALSLLISAWLVGALGGLHCAAMCGGLLAAVTTRDASTQPLLPARVVAWRQLAYHAGRVTTYVLLGTAFGAAGGMALGAVDFLPLQRTLYVVANVLLIMLGTRVAVGRSGTAWLQRSGANVFAAVLPVVRPLLRRSDPTERVVLGLVWGLVPCAMVYSVLPLALFAGGAWQGGAVMLAFGLGTVPNLLAGGLVLDRARLSLNAKPLRYAAAAVLIGFGAVGTWRVLAHPDWLAQGPFCLVP